MQNYRYVYSAVFITLIVVVFNIIILELFVRYIVIPKDSYYQKEQLIRSTDLPALDYIALGDSHPFNDLLINDNDFFNFAYHSENIVQSYYKFKFYLKQGLKPSFVLLQADDHCFSQYRESISDYTRYERFLSNDDKRELKHNFPEVFLGGQTRSFSGLIQFSPEYAPFIHKTLWKYIRNGFKLKKEKEFITAQGSGINHHVFSDLTQDERTRDATKRFAKQFPDLEKVTSPRLLAYLEKTIRLCQQYNIEPILIRYPISPTYDKILQENIQKSVVKELRKVSQKYDIAFYDFSQSIFEEKLFSDQDHLNERGARVLGELIKKKLFDR